MINPGFKRTRQPPAARIRSGYSNPNHEGTSFISFRAAGQARIHAFEIIGGGVQSTLLCLSLFFFFFFSCFIFFFLLCLFRRMSNGTTRSIRFRAGGNQGAALYAEPWRNNSRWMEDSSKVNNVCPGRLSQGGARGVSTSKGHVAPGADGPAKDQRLVPPGSIQIPDVRGLRRPPRRFVRNDGPLTRWGGGAKGGRSRAQKRAC